MPATILDSAIFRDIFTTEAMRNVLSDENRMQKYLDFEAALARAQAQARDHPAGGLRRNRQALHGRPRSTSTKLKEAKPSASAIRCCRWCSSWSSSARTGSANGATGAPPPRTSPTPPPSCRSARRSPSSRRTSTASRDALGGARQEVPRHADGRPQQPAAGGADHLRLQDGDLSSPPSSATSSGSKQLKQRVLVGEFGGAAGTLSSLGKDGLRDPGRADEGARARPAGDRLAHGARPHRRGRLLPRPRHRHLRQDRLRREADDADRGRGGVTSRSTQGRGSSSTMPQKRNPISSVYITAQTARGAQPGRRAARRAWSEDHERSTGPWEIEWIVLPEIFVLIRRRLAQTRFLCRGLQVDEKRMRANLDITKGLIVSEAVMMGLGPHLGRNYAHDLVYDICREVVKTGRPLVDLLAENKEIAKHLDRSRARKAVRSGQLSRRPARWWTGC